MKKDKKKYKCFIHNLLSRDYKSTKKSLLERKAHELIFNVFQY